ncbi:transposase [Thiocystis minor]|uniref:transposase n=1 Tax=Thiocystis minor TaxID=61597 RepID=UPI0023EE36F0|nr:transposase [Thiocystis minor]
MGSPNQFAAAAGDVVGGNRIGMERTIAWLKGFRAIRTRYVCQARNYLAMIHLACALILFRKLQPAAD